MVLSEQFTLQGDTQISALVSTLDALQQDINDAAKRCTFLESSLTTLQSESKTILKQDASPAMDSLLELVNHIELLHQATQERSALAPCRDPTSTFGAIQAHTLLVNACKSQSRLVFDHFRSLSKNAKGLMERFTKLTTEFTFEIALAQERTKGLRNIAVMAETLQSGIEDQRKSWLEQKMLAEISTQQAKETLETAKRKYDSENLARGLRNFLTIGLGEVFDLFGWNGALEDAGQMVWNAQQNAQACEQIVQQTVTELRRIDDEVARLNLLSDTAREQETTLQVTSVHGQALRTHAIDLTNASLDVSLFVGSLAAKSETFAVHHDAQEFAQGVLNFARQIFPEERLNGLLGQGNYGRLQDTLFVITRSDGDGNSIADDDRSVKTLPVIEGLI